ncbi:peptide ABC transporter substrate-binding protein [Billgrantia endophytica]|uniref:Peptide ABC transporter substrate-binding protein n=2 Tax=Billgrantia endophytica TaxID=2033802 RepID=A0A2N7UAV4_9GAMM|nr:peptide ABC transporter substrate-binding protein [Halomonas endophytica]
MRIAHANVASTGGVLRYATLGLDTSDPHRHTGSIGVQQVFVEALTSIGPDGGIEPFLAESFEVSDDGRVYTFHLRPDVRFHNGDVMTAADVAANIERVRTHVTGGWLASAMAFVERVETPDDTTVVLTMQRSYAPLLALMSELWVLSPKSDGWDDTISLPIGTGPFHFGNWQPNVQLVSPRHSGYWQPELPHVDTIRFDLREDTDNALALRAGDLHIGVIDRASAEQLAPDPAIDIKPLKDSNWFFISFNNRNPRPPFDDVRVRKAITYAIDKAAFIRFTAGDYGVVTNQMVKPGNLYFDQSVHDADVHAEPDLDKARELLQEAGVDPSTVTIQFISWQESYPQVVVQMVRSLGFQVNHVALDDLGAQNRLGEYDWDMNCMASGPRADIFLRYVRLMSDGPNPVLWGGVQDPEFDRLVNEAVGEPDFEERKALYLAAWQRAMDNYYTVVLGHGSDLIAVRQEVEGFDTGFTWSPNWAGGGVGHAQLVDAS